VQLSRRNLVTSSDVVVPDPLAELDAPLLILPELLPELSGKRRPAMAEES